MEKLSDLYANIKSVDLQNKIIMEGIVDYSTEKEITEIVKLMYNFKRKSLTEYTKHYTEDCG
jgi:hypothetical protein